MSSLYAGLFLVTLATLLYEILLTRIFSVVTWYHFAFVAVSVAMFGMTAGAILVYSLPGRFSAERARHHLALSSLLFSVSLAACFLVQTRLPFSTDPTPAALLGTFLTFGVISVPFTFSGICVCLALTSFPAHVGRLYAADLLGASAGCVVVIYLLKVTDGPTAVIATAFVAAAGAVVLSLEAGSRRLLRLSAAAAALLLALSAGHTILVWKQAPILRLASVKGSPEPRPLYEKWNSFSRIRVRDPFTSRPLGWGLSPAFRPERPIRQLVLDIDGGASTVLTGLDGGLEDAEHLKYDVTSLAHYLRQRARVLAIGVGGGRDILAALVFEQRSVVGVEINEDIIDTVNSRFGDFTGHLDRDPRVTFVNDEARSYVARRNEAFDIIQASLIDTSAATAAGAFVFTENALYTTEAWEIFLDHLAPGGVLTFSWFYFADRPGEMYRLTSLAREALTRRGVADPRGHIVVVRHRAAPKSVGTILVSPRPLSTDDLARIDEVTRRLRFDLVLSPTFSLDPVFGTIASGKRISTVGERPRLRIDAPDDNSPFFFNMLLLRDVFHAGSAEGQALAGNVKAVALLGILLVTVLALTALCVFLPPLLARKTNALREGAALVLYFAGIGFGFMLIEISQMQRLTIFLGHPTYGLSVVLFTLLLAGGLGSFSTGGSRDAPLRWTGGTRLLCLVGVLVMFGIATPYVTKEFQGAPTSIRVLVSALLLSPLGLFMGMAFPVGMRIASTRSPALTPWLWGINGAASICASVLAVAISLSSGISASFWSGAACYAVALGAFVRAAGGIGGAGRATAPPGTSAAPASRRPTAP